MEESASNKAVTADVNVSATVPVGVAVTAENTTATYLDKLRTWATWTVAMILFSLIQVLVAKWSGLQLESPPSPPPAQILVVSPDGCPLSVTVLK